MAGFVFLSEKNRERYLRVIGPIGSLFARTGIHPNILSVAGLVLSVIAGLMYGSGSFFWAAWVVVLAGTCDALDGQVARQANKNSTFGAFLDSTLDRYSDVFLFLGLAYCFAGGKPIAGFHGGNLAGSTSPWTVIVIVLALTGSFMVSYTRARAEGLGVECKGGLMQRPERVVLLIIGSLLGSIPKIGPVLMQCTLLILAISTNVTAISRIFHVRNQILRGNRVT